MLGVFTTGGTLGLGRHLQVADVRQQRQWRAEGALRLLHRGAVAQPGRHIRYRDLFSLN